MIAVTGVAGQLGTAFRRLLPDAHLLTHQDLDLAEPTTIAAALTRLAPSAIINCAAYTAVDRAESEEDLATVINGVAVGEMARFAADAGIPFVSFSTDYVFDGQAKTPYVESSPTNPLNAYGRSKVAGERLALPLGALVIRTSWVISGTHGNFVTTMLRRAAGEGARVVDDQIGRPTMAGDLAAATLAALEAGVTGLLHLTNTGDPVSWYGLAREAVGCAGLDVDRITPIPTSEYPTPAPRPAFSVLASERLGALGLAGLPDWRRSLPAVVAELRGMP